MPYSLMYKSQALVDFNRHELRILLSQSRKNNIKLGVTGILLYANRTFIQLLEGDKDTVLSLYQEIRNDSRHRNITTLMQKEVEKRMYADWAMSYKGIEPEEYENIPGFTLFLDNDEVADPLHLLTYLQEEQETIRV